MSLKDIWPELAITIASIVALVVLLATNTIAALCTMCAVIALAIGIGRLATKFKVRNSIVVR